MNEREALELAVAAAVQSPCSKSKRGVIGWSEAVHEHISAFNGPPPGFDCDGSDACRSACGRICMHAEMRVLMRWRERFTDLLHVKVQAGVPVASGPPSCVDCSKAILDCGVRRVWLLHESGLRLYSAEDFHIQSLLHLDLHVVRSASARIDAKDP